MSKKNKVNDATLTPNNGHKPNYESYYSTIEAANTGEKESQDLFEAEIKLYSATVFDFLRAISHGKEPAFSIDRVVLAVNELKTKRRFDTSTIPGMGESEKLLLELLVYDTTGNPIDQSLIRRDIQRDYTLTNTAFDRTYREFKKRVGGASDYKLKLEITALMAETDPIARMRKRAEICIYHGISAKDLDKAIQALKAETQKSEFKVYDLDDFLSQGSEAIDWIIPGLLPKGETVLLTAMPKVGKTLLAVDLAFCLATGENSFLGESHKPAKVLFVSTDESRRSTRAKMLKRGFRNGDQNIKTITEWKITQMNELESALEYFRPDVTIIDSLKRITLGKEISENSAEFGDMVYELKETLERYGSAGLLIHHSNKDKDQTGLGCVRGNTSIVGAVWGVWQLDYQKTSNQKEKATYNPSDPKRTLTVSARDVQGQTLDLELDPEQNSFKRLESEGDREAKSQADKILDVLHQNPYGLNGKAIAAMTGIKSVYSVLNRLESRRLISTFPAPDDRRRTIYKVSDNPPPPPPYSNFEAISDSQIAETQSPYEEKIDHKLDHKHLLSEAISDGQIAETQSPQGKKIDCKLDHSLSEKIDRSPEKTGKRSKTILDETATYTPMAALAEHNKWKRTGNLYEIDFDPNTTTWLCLADGQFYPWSDIPPGATESTCYVPIDRVPAAYMDDWTKWIEKGNFRAFSNT